MVVIKESSQIGRRQRCRALGGYRLLCVWGLAGRVSAPVCHRGWVADRRPRRGAPVPAVTLAGAWSLAVGGERALEAPAGVLAVLVCRAGAVGVHDRRLVTQVGGDGLDALIGG